MGVKDLISGGGEKVHPKSIKATNEKLRREELCPDCGSENTEEGQIFRKCKNKDCETLSYRHPTYSVDLDKVWD